MVRDGNVNLFMDRTHISILMMTTMISPWHGACFRVQTGDMEDGPGFDSLQKYSVEIVNKQIIISADEDGQLKKKEKADNFMLHNVKIVLSNPRRDIKPCSRRLSNQTVVVIVGGGPAGLGAAIGLRNVMFFGYKLKVYVDIHE
jgi:heterodisulfide reductase subunit A-like polyferredoxin